jgi:hypothetical protein
MTLACGKSVYNLFVERPLAMTQLLEVPLIYVNRI